LNQGRTVLNKERTGLMKMRIQRTRFVTIAALLTVVVMAGVGCKKKIVDPFPASGAVAGWEKSGKTQTFDAANLYEYIDGGAEQYISAGVVGVATSDYKFQGSLEATVDVYTMKTADGDLADLTHAAAKAARSAATDTAPLLAVSDTQALAEVNEASRCRVCGYSVSN